MNDVKKTMQKVLDHFQDELKSLRTSRPNPSILENVVVEIYGSEMKIRDLGSTSIIDGRQLLVTPFDPQTAAAIAKGIDKANLNLQAIVDGNMIRVPIPPMSEEIRKNIVKDAKKKAEDAKVIVREHRRKANDLAKKQKGAGEISEDQLKKSEKTIQEYTDQFCKKIDELYTAKEKDIMEV